MAQLLADSDTGASKGGLFDDSKTLSQLIGRPTTPMSEVVKQMLVR
jgi:NAD(P)H dehydrogenase (quinone)